MDPASHFAGVIPRLPFNPQSKIMNRFFCRHTVHGGRAAGVFAATTNPLAICALGLLLTTPIRDVEAQGAQKFGAQISVLGTSIETNNGSQSAGIGLEAQLRINHLYRSPKAGVFSLGVGGQWTSHKSGPDEITITGVFVEPRWVPPLPFERVFPYVALRVAGLNQSNNFGTSSTGGAVGAGGGIAFVINSHINVDAGVALVSQSFGDFTFTRPGLSGTGTFDPFITYAAKIGLSIGFPK